MQKYLIEYRLLHFTPVLFILLLMALAQHHHHFEYYRDGEDSLHFLPSAFHLDLEKHDAVICVAPAILLNSISLLWTRNSDNPHAPVTTLITDPPQSRAPPPMLLF